MAPLCRCRCSDHKTGIANDLMKSHYELRSDYGLLITDACPVSQQGNGFYRSAGIYTKEQTQGWKKVTEAVHKKDGVIVVQLFHCGRVSNEEITMGLQPIAPSEIQIKSLNAMGKMYPIPRKMSLEDIKQSINEFYEAAKNAKEAGFDGAQLHAANGFLVDQFLRDGTNSRKDQYGGSVENRCRFCLEILDKFIEVFGKGRVGIRISLLADTMGCLILTQL